MFDTLTSSFKGIMNKIRFSDDEKALQRACDELKKTLLKNDVYHKATKHIVQIVQERTKQEGYRQTKLQFFPTIRLSRDSSLIKGLWH